MAAVHLHNALFMPASPPATSFSSRSSTITSGATSSDMLSTRQFVDMQQAPSLSYPERKHTGERRSRRHSRIWTYAMIVLSFGLLVWVTYCTARYFVAFRIYGGDTIRSRYALGIGIASIFTLFFYASQSLMILRFPGRHRRSLIVIFHSLTYLSSALVMSIAIINLTLVFRWRRPHGPADVGRSIQGRCNWDLDVVWSGTGGACASPDDTPYGDWLGAAIFRLVITAVLLVAYHLSGHGYLGSTRLRETVPEMIFIGDVDKGHNVVVPNATDESRPLRRSRGPHGRDSSLGTSGTVKRVPICDDEPTVRPLSFTEAGQVLSRIEGSEVGDEDDHESSSPSSSDSNHDSNEATEDRPRFPDDGFESLPRSESPEPLAPPSLTRSSSLNRGWYPDVDAPPPNPPPSSFHRPIAASSNDLQDFASTFRTLVSRISRDTQEGMALDHVPELPVVPRENDTVRVLGSYISRMSTIESMASREVASSVRSPSRSDTSPSSGSAPSSYPESANLSRNTTLNRGRDKMTGSPLLISSET